MNKGSISVSLDPVSIQIPLFLSSFPRDAFRVYLGTIRFNRRYATPPPISLLCSVAVVSRPKLGARLGSTGQPSSSRCPMLCAKAPRVIGVSHQDPWKNFEPETQLVSTKRWIKSIIYTGSIDSRSFIHYFVSVFGVCFLFVYFYIHSGQIFYLRFFFFFFNQTFDF